MNLQFQSLLPSLHTQSHLPQRGRQQSMYNFENMYILIDLQKLYLAPSDEGAVDCKLTVRQFTLYKSTEGVVDILNLFKISSQKKLSFISNYKIQKNYELQLQGTSSMSRLKINLSICILSFVDIINLQSANRTKIPQVSHFLTGEQLSEHQRKRAVGEV